jgi:hypothetical protein
LPFRNAIGESRWSSWNNQNTIVLFFAELALAE